MKFLEQEKKWHLYNICTPRDLSFGTFISKFLIHSYAYIFNAICSISFSDPHLFSFSLKYLMNYLSTMESNIILEFVSNDWSRTYYQDIHIGIFDSFKLDSDKRRLYNWLQQLFIFKTARKQKNGIEDATESNLQMSNRKREQLLQATTAAASRLPEAVTTVSFLNKSFAVVHEVQIKTREKKKKKNRPKPLH